MILLLLGCDELADVVTMYGTTYDAPKGEGSILPGVSLRSVHDDGTTEVGSTVSDDDGIFYLDMPAGLPFFVLADKDGYVPTAFSGTASVGDFYAGFGLPWIVDELWVSSLRTVWAACPGAESGNFLVGEARMPLDGVTEAQALPLMPDVAVTFTQSDGTEATACYLDDDGVADPDAEGTSGLGAWAVFDVVEGPGLLEVTIPTEDGTASEIYKEMVPEGGLVGVYPALIPES